jgi:hypothetical protein
MKRRSWFWGISFLLTAAFIIAVNVTGFDEITIPGIITTILSIALLVETIVHRHYPIIPVPIGALYFVYQLPFNFPYIDIKYILVSVICLAFAIFFLSPRRKKTVVQVEADGFAYVTDNAPEEPK